jgi:hypothetical protein
MKQATRLLALVALTMEIATYGVDLRAQDVGTSVAQGVGYEVAISKWSSYQDVANWLKANFAFDQSRLGNILVRTRQNGPAGLLARGASGTYDMKSGYCTDAAAFAIQSLNRINPDYKARYVFIKNRFGQPHHWVAGFLVDGKIMVMDYGASSEWGSMNGVHGPYDSLDQYAEFLNSLRIPRFSPESVEWKSTLPGQQD